MKDWRRKKINRAINALSDKIKGCTSATCPFSPEVEGRVGTANICDCQEEARLIVKQLASDIKGVQKWQE